MIDNTLTPISSPVAVKDQLGSYYHDKWERAHTLFPKRNFPWDVLPQKIADSLQQLARSCASSSNALPGAAIAIFASVLGSTISISPKESWEEPLIFWFADIRGSGQGKTPSTRALRKVLNDAQKLEDLAYSKPCCQDESDQALDVEPVSPRPRGYFMTDFTLEGLRKELLGSPHGGIVCIMNELSSIITLQNQYKGKGNDRESLIGLHDGDPVRVIRADGADTIEGSRVSIFGGIQPEVWKRIFGGEKGLYTVDGTVFRFLPTYEPNYFHELTSETWSPKNEAAWKSLVTSALAWGNVRVSTKDWEPLILSFDEEAQARFIDWRNDLFGYKAELPAIINGFMPNVNGHEKVGQKSA